jgi:GTPase
MPKPVVALVGRPNVGKSTLFNRLVGERLAIVDETPGTTRDRLLAESEWNGVEFLVIDTGGIDPTHGGKTPLSIGSADFIEQIKEQALIAIEDADAILFLTDAEAGIRPPTGKWPTSCAATRRNFRTEIFGRRSFWWSTREKARPAA